MERKSMLRRYARAAISGGPGHAGLRGTVDFIQTAAGVLVTADIFNLPHSPEMPGFFGFHIHTGFECSGTESDPFANAGAHYNPANAEHPYHAGDLPPLMNANGRAYLSVLTSRFKLSDVIGRAVIIHAMPDDFHTQPSGESGMKIACGIIQARA